MPQTPHIEKHFTAGDTVRDVVIGMADGLNVKRERMHTPAAVPCREKQFRIRR